MVSSRSKRSCRGVSSNSWGDCVYSIYRLTPHFEQITNATNQRMAQISIQGISLVGVVGLMVSRYNIESKD
jgi:hypothetical protein